MASSAVTAWMPSDTSLVGSSVRMVLTTGDNVSGKVFSYDSACITVEEEAPAPKRAFRLISTSTVAEIETVGEPLTEEELRKELAVDLTVDASQVEAFKAKAMQRGREKAAQIGDNVSAEAQQIFNALAKTLPCRWAATTIIVMDEVQIEPPYVPESCALRHGPGSSFTLERVKKVLQGERRRMKT